MGGLIALLDDMSELDDERNEPNAMTAPPEPSEEERCRKQVTLMPYAGCLDRVRGRGCEDRHPALVGGGSPVTRVDYFLGKQEAVDVTAPILGAVDTVYVRGTDAKCPPEAHMVKTW